MISWLRSLWSWRAVHSTGVWTYTENTVTGQRSAHWRGGGYQPLDSRFIRDGDVVHGPRGRYIVGHESEHWFG